jgi:hypothetical protein
MDFANSAPAEEGGSVSEQMIVPQQASLLRWTKTRPSESADRVGSDKFVVPTRSEANNAFEREPNWRSQLDNRKSPTGLNLLPPHNGLHFAVRLHKLQIVMKNRFSILHLVAFAAALLSFASMAAGHERDTFKIGDKYDILTVGSLNEPFIVDNISGS